MKPHPATQFKGNYPEVKVDNDNPLRNIIIGKRSGIPIKNDDKTGFDFILQDTMMGKSNCPTIGKKTQTNLFPESSDSSSSSSSESDSESLNSSMSEDVSRKIYIEGKSQTYANDMTHNNNEDSSININLIQIADDLQCPTNYDNNNNNEDSDEKKMQFDTVLSSKTRKNKNGVSPNNSEVYFKSKEEIYARNIINNTFKTDSSKYISDNNTIEGISSIKKLESSSNGSFLEEDNMLKEAFELKRKGKQSNKTIFEEVEEDINGNRQSQQALNNNSKESIQANSINNQKDSLTEKSTVNLNDKTNNEISNNSLRNNDTTENNSINSQEIKIPIPSPLVKPPSLDHNLNNSSNNKFAHIKVKENKFNNSSTALPSKKEIYYNPHTLIKHRQPKREISEAQYLINAYQMSSTFRNESYEVLNQNKSFGIDNRYSLRTRIPRLNILLGEKIKYIRTKNGDQIKEVISNRRHFNNYIKQFTIIETTLIKQKKLSKPMQQLKEDYIKNIKENNTIELIIKPYSMKAITINYQLRLILEIKESNGLNHITINGIKYRNSKVGTLLSIGPNEQYEIRNHSINDLIIFFYSEEHSKICI